MSQGALFPNFLFVAAVTLAALAAGTVVRLLSLRGASREVAHARLGSLATWWIAAIVVLAVAILGRAVGAALFAVLSAIALREFASLTLVGRVDRIVLWAAMALIPLNYLLLAAGWTQAYVALMPLAALFLLALVWVLRGNTAGFVENVVRMYFGFLVTTYCVGYTVLCFGLPTSGDGVGGGGAWFLFLVLLTEGNDICQALVGRKIGRHHILPQISPHKTWEGFVGGAVITMGVAVLFGRWLTPLGPAMAALAGLVIATSGFLGDVNISAVKRDSGVKDSGQLLPGQGGMLDRVDSLSFAAPAFYYFALFFEHYNL